MLRKRDEMICPNLTAKKWSVQSLPAKPLYITSKLKVKLLTPLSPETVTHSPTDKHLLSHAPVPLFMLFSSHCFLLSHLSLSLSPPPTHTHSLQSHISPGYPPDSFINPFSYGGVPNLVRDRLFFTLCISLHISFHDRTYIYHYNEVGVTLQPSKAMGDIYMRAQEEKNLESRVGSGKSWARRLEANGAQWWCSVSRALRPSWTPRWNGRCVKMWSAPYLRGPAASHCFYLKKLDSI